MPTPALTYAQLLETNNLIQQNADETYWLCATRTVQESKIFPVSAYILFSYLRNTFRLKKLATERVIKALKLWRGACPAFTCWAAKC